jgi:hypothetical protein
LCSCSDLRGHVCAFVSMDVLCLVVGCVQSMAGWYNTQKAKPHKNGCNRRVNMISRPVEEMCLASVAVSFCVRGCHEAKGARPASGGRYRCAAAALVIGGDWW